MTEPYNQLSALAAGLRERYDVLREVGRGGMATVYLGRDLRHDRSVALKVMHPELAASVGAERFQREIRISASLTHPHILPLHDSGEVDGMLYYVMPYIEGESLRNMLDRERQLSLDAAVTLMREILDALGYAHAQGFVHRDVKPENILISGGHALVSDFGIARVAGIVTTTGITQSGLAVGSPVYMSPEQGAAEPHLDGRSDLYSAACVLFEMLVGAPPFTGASALRLLSRHAIDPVPSVVAVRSDVGAAIDAVIARAMEKDPEDRYPSSRAFRIALDAATATAPAQDGVRTSQPQYVATSATQERPGLSSGSVAVLPFADKSVSQDQEFLCDGIADEVRSALARLPSLKVAARSASLPYRNRTVAPADLGRELNVGSVLEGTVQRMGDRLRISAFLSDTSDGRELWSERYDREASDIFALQDDIAASVVNSLRVTLSGLDHRAMVKRPTASVEAYQLYLRGRHLWNHRQAGSTQKAIQCFREALEIDPLYALPYAGLADAFASLGAYEYMRPIDAFPKATASAERALSLDATLAEAHTTLGVAQAHYAWDWRAGEQSYLEAIALNPRYALAHTYYALLLSATGRHERAADAIARAAEIDPISVPILTIKGYVAYYARRYDDAIHDYRIALGMDPTFGLAMVLLGYANLSRGNYDESIRVFRSIPSPRLTSIGGLGIALGLTGRMDEARALLAQMEAARTTEYISAFTLSQMHLGLGDRDTALSLLEVAVAERSYNLSFVAPAQPFDSLRDEPRFAAVLKSIGLEHVPGALVRR